MFNVLISPCFPPAVGNTVTGKCFVVNEYNDFGYGEVIKEVDANLTLSFPPISDPNFPFTTVAGVMDYFLEVAEGERGWTWCEIFKGGWTILIFNPDFPPAIEPPEGE